MKPTVSQPDLFSGHVMARATDGPGSHIAADAMQTSGKAKIQRQSVLAALRRYPGSTSRQLAQLSGLDRYVTARRLPELAVEGTVRRVQPEGAEIVWWPAV